MDFVRKSPGEYVSVDGRFEIDGLAGAYGFEYDRHGRSRAAKYVGWSVWDHGTDDYLTPTSADESWRTLADAKAAAEEQASKDRAAFAGALAELEDQAGS